MISTMATPKRPTKFDRIRAGVKPHLYISEHLDRADLSDAVVGARTNHDRATIYKWRKNPQRLKEWQIAELASAMPPHPDGEPFHPEDFRRPPGQISVDRILDSQPEKQRKMIIDVVLRMVGRGS